MERRCGPSAMGARLTRRGLPGDAADRQSRYIEAAVNGVLIASIYAPNGNPQPGPKFDYKLARLDRLAAHAADLYASGAPVVLAGDYNVVPTDLDIYSTKSWDRDALLQPESRAAYRRLLSQGWTDAVRALHPKEPMYTFWDYMRNRCERDGGLRLDHILLSSALTVNTCKAPALTATSAEYRARAIMRPYGSNFGMRRTAGPLLPDMLAAARQLRARRLCPKQRNRPVGPAPELHGEVMWRAEASPYPRVPRC